jgi:hypothetical protein
MNNYLIRVYGDVEPDIVEGPFSSIDVSKVVVEYFKKEPYNDKDGLFLLTIDEEGSPDVFSFSSAFMHQCNEFAANVVTV